jgi:hypothetical protein
MSIKCVRLDNDCADLCTVAARILARQTGYDAPTAMAIIEATRTVLRASADAAEEFKGTPYFELSAKECRETEQLLGRLAEQMGSSDAGEGYPTSPPSATTPAGASMGGGGAETSGTSEASQRSPRSNSARCMDELRDMARDKGLRGVHDMRKEELIDAISGKRGSWRSESVTRTDRHDHALQVKALLESDTDPWSSCPAPPPRSRSATGRCPWQLSGSTTCRRAPE